MVCGRGSERWRELMDATRAVAVELVEEGVVEITQRGKKVDVTSFRGPIRLRLSRPPVEPSRGEVSGKKEKEAKDEAVKVERVPLARPSRIALIDRPRTEKNVAAERERAAPGDAKKKKKRRKTERDA